MTDSPAPVDHRPIRVPLRERMRDFRMQMLPGVVWLTVCAAVALLWANEPKSAPVSGLAYAPSLAVSAPEAGLVDGVFVELFQDVQAGQLLVTLASTTLQSDMEVAQAELAQLAALREAERASLEFEFEQARSEIGDDRALTAIEAQAERLRRIRQFRGDEQDAEVELLEAIVRRVEADFEVERTQIQLDRAEGLRDDAVGSRADVEDLQARLGQVQARAETELELEQGLRLAVEEARTRRVEYEESDETLPPISELDPRLAERLAGHEASLAVQRARIAQLESRVAGMAVRAPQAGRVASLGVLVGSQALLGQNLLNLDPVRAEQVLMYIPESQVQLPELGATVVVRRGTEQGEATVVAVAAQVSELPPRLWRDPRYAEFGRAYRLGAITGLTLSPGERVGLVPNLN